VPAPDHPAATAGLREYAARLAGDLDALLGGALAAAYLHGSAALGGWLAERSDVDILFVAGDDLSGQASLAGSGQLEAACGLLTRSGARCPGRGLEASIVTISQAARPAPPWAFVLHAGFGDGGRTLVRGDTVPGDPDLLMHYAVCRAAGITVAGPPPAAVIGAVRRPQILAYLAGELGWGLANAPESYAVLNACRALVYLNEGRIVSKVAGGLAALDRGIGPAGVLRRALDQQQARAAERAAGPDAILFVRESAAALSAAAAGWAPSPPA
jgi:streptomycin 3"-adenylyltransferase